MTTSSTPRYLRLWRGLLPELGYTLTTLPIVIASLCVLVTGLSAGAGLIIVWIGIPLLVFTLLAARWFGSLELRRLEAAGRPPIARPDWRARPMRRGVTGRILHVLTDGRYWVQALHGAVVNVALGIATWTVVVVWIAMALGGPTYWFWGRWAESDVPLAPVTFALAGLIAVVSLPMVVHGMVLVHDVAARAMLGEWSRITLLRDVAVAEASRESAILAEDSSLRRLERDIHDGPQQGLLRIQFDLASAERKMQPGDAALPLVEGALQLTKETLRELRELSRGLAPPLLQDRGLVSAITALAARSEIPVTTSFGIEADEASLAEVERSVYFVVSELLSNAAKHSHAQAATIRLTTDTDGPARRTLRIEVVDDGIGGASHESGHGLEGIGQRIAGLRGTFVIDSPAGGPSLFVIEIPLR